MEPINDITETTTEATTEPAPTHADLRALVESVTADLRTDMARRFDLSDAERLATLDAFRTDIEAMAERIDRTPLPDIAIETITAAIEEITTGGDFRCQ